MDSDVQIIYESTGRLQTDLKILYGSNVLNGGVSRRTVGCWQTLFDCDK